jgi:RNA polymerase sigma factor for flagellar operon FliA
MTATHTTHNTVEGAAAAKERRNALVLEELPQVYFIAARILERLPQHVEIDDLVNAGVIGLIEACQSFDSSKNAQFKTFAKFRIRGAILDSLRMLDWGSRRLRRRARQITEATAMLEVRFGRPPGKEEIAKEMQLTPAQLDAAMMQLQGLHIAGQQTASFDGEAAYDVIESAASTWENPFELYCREEEKAKLAAAVASLSEREQLILSLYYVEELTMQEVATVVGVVLSRVSQIHHAALIKLKRKLGHLELDPVPATGSVAQEKRSQVAPR